MILTPDIFKGELQLIFDKGSCGKDEVFDWIVAHYEPIILHRLIGKLYFELLEKIENDEIVGDWDILLNGGTYECGGCKYQFKGLKYLLACYIYFYYVREQQVDTVKHGGIRPLMENATVVDLKYKAVRNWNNAKRMTKSTRCSKGFNTLEHFLYCSELTNYCVNFYGGGSIIEW